MDIRHIIVAAVGLALGACVTAPPPRYQPPPATANIETPAPQVRCPNCGRVVRIEVLQVTTPSRHSGAILGGVVGGVVSGTTTGASADKPTIKPSYRIAILMDDGRHLVLSQEVISPNLREGSNVRVENGRVILLR
jgi:outer membrane lipoprotein SlyB